MKIDEVIADLGDDIILYIGSKTGWFFIGTKAQYLELEPAINKYLIQSLKDSIYKDVATIRSTFRSITADLVTCKKSHANPNNILVDAGRRYSHYFNLIRAKKDFVPIQDRVVLDHYVKIAEYDDGGSYGIKVVGEEESPYCIIEDWNKAHALRRIQKWAKK